MGAVFWTFLHSLTPYWLRTFHGDFNDVVCNTQPVCGRAAVLSSVTFHHIGNLECFLEGLKGYPTARQLSSIFLPGDIWSRPVIDRNTNTSIDFGAISAVFKSWVLTYKPSAMHSNSRVSPLRTILVLVDPIGYMNLGWWSPSGLSEGTRTRWRRKQKDLIVDI